MEQIPLVELFLVFSILGLGGLGYLTILRRKNSADKLKFGPVEDWILAGLIGLAVLATVLLFFMCLVSL